MINYAIRTDVDTRNNSKIYVLRISEKLNVDEYRKKANGIYDIGGYYSKFKKGFIFREQPKVNEIEMALNGKQVKEHSKINVYTTEYDKDGLVTLVKDGAKAYSGANISNPESAVAIFNEIFKLNFATEEKFCMLTLNTNADVTGAFEVSRGDLNSATISPREIFKKALLCNACAVIFAHNHPSGSKMPSADDIATTNKLVDGGKILGISIHDSIIIVSGGYLSLREQGVMK